MTAYIVSFLYNKKSKKKGYGGHFGPTLFLEPLLD